MNIFVYSDESGVFDKKHNDIFVFAGLIIIGTDEKEKWSRLYAKAEKDIRYSKKVGKNYELKATQITNNEKGKLFRSLNKCYKFAVIVNQKRVLNEIFENKKSKQRYLDYVYKIAVKRAFEDLLEKSVIKCTDVKRIFFYVDEHTTATNGRYELNEALEQEFRYGTYNNEYSVYYPPIFNYLEEVKLEYCNSESKLLVRAADIVANKVYYLARTNESKLSELNNINIIRQP